MDDKSLKAPEPKYNAQDKVNTKSEPNANPAAGKNGGFGSEPNAKDMATHYVCVKPYPKVSDYIK